MWNVPEGAIDGACGVTSALSGIEICDRLRRLSCAASSGVCGADPAAAAATTWAGDEPSRVEGAQDGLWMGVREDVREDQVPMVVVGCACAVVEPGREGLGVVGADRRARLRW